MLIVELNVKACIRNKVAETGARCSLNHARAHRGSLSLFRTNLILVLLTTYTVCLVLSCRYLEFLGDLHPQLAGVTVDDIIDL